MIETLQRQKIKWQDVDRKPGDGDQALDQAPQIAGQGLPEDQVLAGFANSGVLSVVVLYVVAAGMYRTGAISRRATSTARIRPRYSTLTSSQARRKTWLSMPGFGTMPDRAFNA